MDALRVAAIQLRAKVGEVAWNLARAEAVARDAFRAGARWVVLPEFFPTAMAFVPAMDRAWLPLEGVALETMRRLAREHDGVVGGSFIARRGPDCFNTFVLVRPDGTCVSHDKDIPTMWENAYFIGGTDDGVVRTPIGQVGIAMCWELIRTRTARRLLGRVDLVVGGSCWWDSPLPVPPRFAADQARMHEVLREAPAALARRLGVPVVHADHAGEFEGGLPGNTAARYASRFLGETQIVDGRGECLARMTYEDGEGFVVADVVPGRVAGELDPIPESFWSTPLSDGALLGWDRLNPRGREHYLQTVRPGLDRADR
jgi:predicted amidohydrolase